MLIISSFYRECMVYSLYHLCLEVKSHVDAALGYTVTHLLVGINPQDMGCTPFYCRKQLIFCSHHLYKTRTFSSTSNGHCQTKSYLLCTCYPKAHPLLHTCITFHSYKRSLNTLAYSRIGHLFSAFASVLGSFVSVACMLTLLDPEYLLF